MRRSPRLSFLGGFRFREDNLILRIAFRVANSASAEESAMISCAALSCSRNSAYWRKEDGCSNQRPARLAA